MVLEINKKAMETLVSTEIDTQSKSEVLNKLKDAIDLLSDFKDTSNDFYKKLMALCLNNIACYYKRLSYL